MFTVRWELGFIKSTFSFMSEGCSMPQAVISRIFNVKTQSRQTYIRFMVEKSDIGTVFFSRIIQFFPLSTFPPLFHVNFYDPVIRRTSERSLGDLKHNSVLPKI